MKKLNFGCGKDIKEDYVNVDIVKGEGVDKVFDFNKFPYPFKANSFNEILIDNVIEHLDDIKKIFLELRRIAKHGAMIEIIVPYYNHVSAYNDFEHKHFVNERTFFNLIEKENLEDYFTIVEQKIKAGIFWRWIPDKIRIPLGHYSPNINQQIKISIAVLKWD